MLDSCIHFGKKLYERKTISKIGNSFSSAKNTGIGIPQGTIITPILFNIMIHDLPKSVSHDTNIVQYMDMGCLDECLT